MGLGENKKYEKEIALIAGGTWWTSNDPDIKQIKNAVSEALSKLREEVYKPLDELVKEEKYENLKEEGIEV